MSKDKFAKHALRGITDSPGQIDTMWHSIVRSNETEYQKNYSLRPKRKKKYTELLSEKIDFLQKEYNLEKKEAVYLISKAIKRLKKDLGEIAVNRNGDFTPSEDNLSYYINEEADEFVKSREALMN